MELKAGERVQIDGDSIDIDPCIVLLYESDSFEEVVSVDDSGSGMSGENSRVVYEAPEDGTYMLIVKDYSEVAVGSYFINVTVTTGAAELTEPDVSRQLLTTTFGNMAWYESERFGFSILEPIEWEAGLPEECDPAVSCYFSCTAAYVVLEDSLLESLQRDQSREGFVGTVEASMSSEPGAKKLSAETITTVQGLVADRVDNSMDGGQMLTTFFAFVDEGKKAFFALFIYAPLEEQEYIDPLIELFFHSFRVRDIEQRDESVAFYLGQAWQLSTERDFEGALVAYAHRIELDPDLMECYRGRASLLNGPGRYNEALVDVDKVLETEQDDSALIALRATILWSMDRLEDALAEMDRAIEVEESGSDGLLNNRALMLSQNGEYGRALADIDMAIEQLEENELALEAPDPQLADLLKMAAEFSGAEADSQ